MPGVHNDESRLGDTRGTRNTIVTEAKLRLSSQAETKYSRSSLTRFTAFGCNLLGSIFALPALQHGH